MYAAAELATRDDGPKEDHIVRLTGLTWTDYERLLETRGDRSAPRLTYLRGVLEIMSPSYDHEAIKSMLARLFEAYCMDRGVDFMPVGSWTIKDKKKERGAEPDECYVFGTERRERPDLAIEVVWTSGGLDKLEVYRLLGVAEVWIWRHGSLSVHVLRGDHYERTTTSARFPELDLDLMLRFLDRPSVTRAVQDFRKALAARP